MSVEMNISQLLSNGKMIKCLKVTLKVTFFYLIVVRKVLIFNGFFFNSADVSMTDAKIFPPFLPLVLFFFVYLQNEKFNIMKRKIKKELAQVFQWIWRSSGLPFSIVFIGEKRKETDSFCSFHDIEKQNLISEHLFRLRHAVWYLCKIKVPKHSPLLSGHGGNSGMIPKT